MAKGKTNRNEPQVAPSSDATTSVFDFERRFPDDAACLDELVRMLYPAGIHCPTEMKVTKHHRIKNRPAYACDRCGHHVYPMKGTIFEGSSTSLKLWMYAMYLMASTRCGISAKQLEREIGVSYPTALRMFRQIRSLLDQDDVLLSGTVEADETFLGGKKRWQHAIKQASSQGGHAEKQPVLGMAMRGESGAKGKIVAKVIPNVGATELVSNVKARVLPASTVYTDEWRSYNALGQQGYTHERINHSEKVYVSGDVHTNTVEGFWSLLRRGLSGVYHSVSDKHLQSYIDEYVFRYNHRDTPGGMFEAFLGRVTKTTD